MLALLPILLLALLDVPEEGGRRAAKNELQNRLGMRDEAGGGDLRSRLVYAVGLIPRDREVFVPAMRLLYDILKTSGWDSYYQYVPTKGNEHLFPSFVVNWAIQRHRDQLPVPGMSTGDVYPFPGSLIQGQLVPALPDAGERNRIEPILAWITRQIVLGPSPASDPCFDPVVVRDSVVNLAEQGPLEQFLDWIEAVHPNLSSMTFAEAWAAQIAWHAQFAGTAAFRTPLTGGVPVVVYPDGARIVRLATKKQCEEEGLSMGHCVGGYWPSVRDGEDLVFSYRDPRGVPQITIELDGDGSLTQFKGPSDERVTNDRAGARMIAWLHGNGIDVFNEEIYAYSSFELPERLTMPDAWLTAIKRFRDLSEEEAKFFSREEAELPTSLTGWFEVAIWSRKSVRRHREALADLEAHPNAPPERLERGNLRLVERVALERAKDALKVERSRLFEFFGVSLNLHTAEPELQDPRYASRWHLAFRLWSRDAQVSVLARAEPLPHDLQKILLTTTDDWIDPDPESERDLLRGLTGPEAAPDGEGDSFFDAVFSHAYFISETERSAQLERLLAKKGGKGKPTLSVPATAALDPSLSTFLTAAQAAGLPLDADTARTLRRLS